MRNVIVWVIVLLVLLLAGTGVTVSVVTTVSVQNNATNADGFLFWIKEKCPKAR